MEVCQNVTHPQFLGMALFVADITALPLTRDCWVGAAAVFLAAALLDWYAPRDNSGKLQAAGLWLLRAGWVLITAMLAYQGLRTRALPITSAAEVLLSIAWGLAGLAGFLDLTFPHPSVTANKPMLMMHVGAAVLAYCVLAAQALNSAAYLLQDRALAKRQFGGIYALLPSLVPLDRVGSQLLGAAVWLLGLSLVIGATDWAQRDLALGAAFARASLWACVPALIALYLSLPHAR
ncbi:MAG: hypothetical protein EBS64_00045 [Verrucomicrobia bacterium]|nr:hypothetical protein [Verrucomicrobiota bacterium]